MSVNRYSFVEMVDQLKETNRSIKDIPLILQCNKQDLPNAVEASTISQMLRIPESLTVSAAAVSGTGTTETLKKLIGKVISRL